ncbi:hypothetical protein GCM10009743_57390 [Kribbella swartbergensis]
MRSQTPPVGLSLTSRLLTLKLREVCGGEFVGRGEDLVGGQVVGCGAGAAWAEGFEYVGAEAVVVERVEPESLG